MVISFESMKFSSFSPSTMILCWIKLFHYILFHYLPWLIWGCKNNSVVILSHCLWQHVSFLINFHSLIHFFLLISCQNFHVFFFDFSVIFVQLSRNLLFLSLNNFINSWLSFEVIYCIIRRSIFIDLKLKHINDNPWRVAGWLLEILSTIGGKRCITKWKKFSRDAFSSFRISLD